MFAKVCKRFPVNLTLDCKPRMDSMSIALPAWEFLRHISTVEGYHTTKTLSSQGSALLFNTLSVVHLKIE